MIEVKDLKKSYPFGKSKIEVLKGVNLAVEKGDMIAIMGRSGSGKSTLLNILAGLDQPDSGIYLYEESRITDKRMDELANFRKKNIGFILQNYPLIDSKNVAENVGLPLRYSKKSNKQRETEVTQVLDTLGINYLKHRWVDMLSGGEAQRVAIARALVQHPDLILADEPTGSLDEETEKDILDLCKRLNHQGKTIILVTHDQHVAAVCHKVYYIQGGTVVDK
ncbi:putative ABC transport system ATP-binding protein [Salsuginibacillus halophilus]|uniref:Putative ABC transport system ATP-binding protein n=2 Tax=Bacillaceae TaxID=186817 RepID=A0A840QSZ4_9BACI|nr:ABC transporter ATP-binding protein [Salsuginibacillus halophilus]MBB5174484.1 putative ABC transport system ATP-binding protein [Texcoconibacillus texcoconensis]PSL50642.1 putative ABC transport system ATP-binding protein [Salsuginibacillus halophilus]